MIIILDNKNNKCQTVSQDEDVYFTHVVFRAQEAQTHQ